MATKVRKFVPPVSTQSIRKDSHWFRLNSNPKSSPMCQRRHKNLTSCCLESKGIVFLKDYSICVRLRVTRRISVAVRAISGMWGTSTSYEFNVHNNPWLIWTNQEKHWNIFNQMCEYMQRSGTTTCENVRVLVHLRWMSRVTSWAWRRHKFRVLTTPVKVKTWGS